MSDLESIKRKIQTVREGVYSEKDIKDVSKFVFLHQLEWDEYPSQDKIEVLIDAVENHREELRKEFDSDLLETLKTKAAAGDVDAKVLLAQYFYDRPKEQRIEDLQIKELIDKTVFGGAGCEDEVSRKRIDTAHQKASELFYQAYEAGSILSMYYLAMLWCNSSHDFVEPKVILERLKERLRTGTITDLNERLIDFIRKGVVLCVYAQPKVEAAKERTDKVTFEKTKLEQWLRQLSHILAHHLHPDMLKDTADQILSENFLVEDHRRKEASISILIQSINEREFINICHMHRLRYVDQDDIASIIRRQRNTIDHVETVNVHELVNQVFLHFFYEVFFIQREKFSNLRRMCSHRIGLSENDIKQKFIDVASCSASLESDISILRWIEGVKIISLELNDEFWKHVKLPSGGIAASIISSHLFELLNNARRACFSRESESLITLKFWSDERQFIDKKLVFLNVEALNFTNEELSKSINLFGSGKGLDMIKQDLIILNNDPENDVSFEQKNDKGEFQVNLRYRKDLFIQPKFIF